MARAQPAGQQLTAGGDQDHAPSPLLQRTSGHNLYEQLFGDNGDDELFVVVRTVRGIRMANNIHLLKRDGSYFADVTELADLLGGKLVWDGQTLSGWFGTETHRLHFDRQTARLTVGNTVNQLRDTDIFVENGLLLADIDLISVMLKVELSLDLPRLTLAVGGRPAPAERILLRQRARRGLDRRGSSDDSAPDFITSSYDTPARGRLDLLASGAYHSGYTSGKTRQRMRKSASLQSTAHFDFANSRMKVTAIGDSSRSLRDVRISARRKRYDETSLYSMLEVGDITGYAAVNAGGGARGTGVKITNNPFFVPDVIGEETITGDAPAGWEVDLYRGDTLIDFTRSDESGRFRFPPVSLTSGMNVFTIKTFGPEGQVETSERKILANHGVPEKGRMRYQFSALETQKTLSGVQERVRCNNAPSCRGTGGKTSLVGNITYAMTNQTALKASLSQIPDTSDHARFASLGLLSNLAGRQWKLDATTASGTARGNALQFYSRLLFGRANGSVTHTEFRNFTGRAATRANYQLRRESKFFLSLPPVSFGGDKTPVRMVNSAILSTNQGRGDRYSRRLTLLQSYSRKRLRLSTSLSGTASNAHRHKYSSQGSVSVTHYVGRGERYGRAQFTVKPDNKLTKLTAGRRYRFKKDHTTTIELNHLPGQGRQTRLKVGLTAERDRYRFGISAETGTKGDHRVSFTLASSLVRSPDRHRQVRLRNKRDATGAAIIVNPFLDHNANNVQDHGEESLSKSKINTSLSPRQILRQGDHPPILDGLPADRPMRIEIEPLSDENLFFATTSTTHDLVLRDGATHVLNVAIRPAGEIAGQLVLRTTDSDGQPFDRPLPRAPIEFLDEQGTRIAATQTIYDGSFVASNVPFGRVTIRLSPAYAKARGLSLPDAPIFTLSKDNVWIDEARIVVTEN